MSAQRWSGGAGESKARSCAAARDAPARCASPTAPHGGARARLRKAWASQRGGAAAWQRRQASKARCAATRCARRACALRLAHGCARRRTRAAPQSLGVSARRRGGVAVRRRCGGARRGSGEAAAVCHVILGLHDVSKWPVIRGAARNQPVKRAENRAAAGWTPALSNTCVRRDCAVGKKRCVFSVMHTFRPSVASVFAPAAC